MNLRDGRLSGGNLTGWSKLKDMDREQHNELHKTVVTHTHTHTSDAYNTLSGLSLCVKDNSCRLYLLVIILGLHAVEPSSGNERKPFLFEQLCNAAAATINFPCKGTGFSHHNWRALAPPGNSKCL